MLLSSHISIYNIAEECSSSGQISIYLIISVVCLIVSKIAITNNTILNDALYSFLGERLRMKLLG